MSKASDKTNSASRTASDPTGFGIQVTRGIQVDVESVKSRKSDDPETAETGAGKHSRTDSETQLSPFLMESPSPSEKENSRGQVSELPSPSRQERQTIVQIPANAQHRQARSPDGPNDTKWIVDDSA